MIEVDRVIEEDGKIGLYLSESGLDILRWRSHLFENIREF